MAGELQLQISVQTEWTFTGVCVCVCVRPRKEVLRFSTLLLGLVEFTGEVVESCRIHVNFNPPEIQTVGLSRLIRLLVAAARFSWMEKTTADM